MKLKIKLDKKCKAKAGAKGNDKAEAKDKVKRWIIPVDDDYNITFPEDLLEQTGWKEGDTLQWIPQDDDSFIMKKVINKDT